MKAFLMMMVMFMGTHAAAADLLTCTSVDGRNNVNRLRVFETDFGYGYEVTTCLKGDSRQVCEPYASRGAIGRDTAPDGSLLMTFSNAEVKVIHLFGEYAYMNTDSKDIRFDDAACQKNAAQNIVEGKGFASGDNCNDPAPLILTDAKGSAFNDAQSKCGTALAQQMTPFDVMTMCSFRQKTAIVTANYRCVKP